MITWAVTTNRSEAFGLARWVSNIIWPGQNREFGNCQGFAVMDNDQLIAGVVYHNYEPDAGVIELSAASTSKRWLTKETLRTMFDIPFKEWGCQAVALRVSDGNTVMHSIALRYGFVHYKIPRLRGRNEAENVFVLTDDAWRENKFNKKEAVDG